MNEKTKYYCPCCGYNSLDKEPPGTYQICRICFWEDDPVQFKDWNFVGGANKVSLIQGQKNFVKYGAVEKRFILYTKIPTKKKYERNPNWKKPCKTRKLL